MLIIEENNLSIAWGKALIAAFDAKKGEIAPLVVVIKDLDNTEPPEIPVIRNFLDSSLRSKANGLSYHEVANTIFPSRLWNSKKSRNCLYERYLNILPFILKHHQNRRDAYFQRLISFGYDRKNPNGIKQLSFGCEEATEKKQVNQLEHIIETWVVHKNHRRTALQASLFDPYKDHSNSPRLGFPCLQQVAFANTGENGLTVTGFYATQYIFRRAYGNYLGLCRLGHFMAHEMGLKLSKVICIATPAMLEEPKKDMKELHQQIKDILNNISDETTHGRE